MGALPLHTDENYGIFKIFAVICLLKIFLPVFSAGRMTHKNLQEFFKWNLGRFGMWIKISKGLIEAMIFYSGLKV